MKTKNQRLVIWIAILASFVAFLDASVVNVALPAIVKELGGGLTTQQWVVDSYLITQGALMLLAGSLSDLLGRVRILRIGLLGFALTSLLCAVAPSSEFLIGMRALQGVAGALLVPSSLALIISHFSGSAQGKAIGTWTAWTGIAFIVGPLLGGFFVDAFSWRLIFAINIIPAAIVFGLLYVLKQKDHPQASAKLDIFGALLCTVGLGGVVYAFIEHAHYGWHSPLIDVAFGVGLVALVWFVYHEKRTKHPMMPLGLFAVRNFWVGNIATLAIYGGLSIATFLVAVFVQQVGHYSALHAGLSLLPVTFIMFELSPRFGALASKYGPRLFMAVGPILAGIGFFTMVRVEASIDYWTQLFPGIVIFGLGLSVTVAPLTSAILSSIHSSQAGIGSAINNAVARIAGLIAISGIGIITGSQLNLAGFRQGLMAVAGLLVIGGLISAFGIRNNLSKRSV